MAVSSAAPASSDQPGPFQPDAEHARGVVVEREQVELPPGQRRPTGASTSSATATGSTWSAVRP